MKLQLIHIYNNIPSSSCLCMMKLGNNIPLAELLCHDFYIFKKNPKPMFSRADCIEKCLSVVFLKVEVDHKLKEKKDMFVMIILN